MPTNRRRSLRRGTVSGDAAVWLATEDAREFFRDPDAYLKGHPGNPYQTPVQCLPGVRPWWPFLWELLSDMRAGKPLGEISPGAVPFVEALEAAYKEMHG